ncbi:hypothetical protein WG66_012635, partial [Moniliophthora roreri]
FSHDPSRPYDIPILAFIGSSYLLTPRLQCPANHEVDTHIFGDSKDHLIPKGQVYLSVKTWLLKGGRRGLVAL